MRAKTIHKRISLIDKITDIDKARKQSLRVARDLSFNISRSFSEVCQNETSSEDALSLIASFRDNCFDNFKKEDRDINLDDIENIKSWQEGKFYRYLELECFIEGFRLRSGIQQLIDSPSKTPKEVSLWLVQGSNIAQGKSKSGIRRNIRKELHFYRDLIEDYNREVLESIPKSSTSHEGCLRFLSLMRQSKMSRFLAPTTVFEGESTNSLEKTLICQKKEMKDMFCFTIFGAGFDFNSNIKVIENAVVSHGSNTLGELQRLSNTRVARFNHHLKDKLSELVPSGFEQTDEHPKWIEQVSWGDCFRDSRISEVEEV